MFGSKKMCYYHMEFILFYQSSQLKYLIKYNTKLMMCFNIAAGKIFLGKAR